MNSCLHSKTALSIPIELKCKQVCHKEDDTQDAPDREESTGRGIACHHSRYDIAKQAEQQLKEAVCRENDIPQLSKHPIEAVISRHIVRREQTHASDDNDADGDHQEAECGRQVRRTDDAGLPRGIARHLSVALKLPQTSNPAVVIVSFRKASRICVGSYNDPNCRREVQEKKVPQRGMGFPRLGQGKTDQCGKNWRNLPNLGSD